jgi:hypothetical protein
MWIELTEFATGDLILINMSLVRSCMRDGEYTLLVFDETGEGFEQVTESLEQIQDKVSQWRHGR